MQNDKFRDYTKYLSDDALRETAQLTRLTRTVDKATKDRDMLIRICNKGKRFNKTKAITSLGKLRELTREKIAVDRIARKYEMEPIFDPPVFERLKVLVDNKEVLVPIEGSGDPVPCPGIELGLMVVSMVDNIRKISARHDTYYGQLRDLQKFQNDKVRAMCLDMYRSDHPYDSVALAKESESTVGLLCTTGGNAYSDAVGDMSLNEIVYEANQIGIDSILRTALNIHADRVDRKNQYGFRRVAVSSVFNTVGFLVMDDEFPRQMVDSVPVSEWVKDNLSFPPYFVKKTSLLQAVGSLVSATGVSPTDGYAGMFRLSTTPVQAAITGEEAVANQELATMDEDPISPIQAGEEAVANQELASMDEDPMCLPAAKKRRHDDFRSLEERQDEAELRLARLIERIEMVEKDCLPLENHRAALTAQYNSIDLNLE